MSVKIIVGDCRNILATLPEQSVQCCVCSPPYWGLRDYKVEGQIGLERDPREYLAHLVGVFRQVRRVLRNDGTLWVNMGDSYTDGGRGDDTGSTLQGARRNQRESRRTRNREGARPFGLGTKQLVGMPWRLALAMQEPYYAGKIKSEGDRVWLAAMLDAEGCLFIHKRKAGQDAGSGYIRQSDTYSPGLEISNTHAAVVARCVEIAGVGSVSTQDEGRRQRLYRWTVRAEECRGLVRELYPHLVAKQHQARIAYGCPTSGERADAAHCALKALHGGSTSDVDFAVPASLLEPGWYLRSDVIWAKPNPMPESVTDRPTKAHEYLFLFSKRYRYFYDAGAIKEPVTGNSHPRGDGVNPKAKKPSGWDAGVGRTHRALEGRYPGTRAERPHSRLRMKQNASFSAAVTGLVAQRNKRDVWTIPSHAYKGAHFATFPPALVVPCVLAGTSPRACELCGAPWKPVYGAPVVTEGRSSGNAERLHRKDHGGPTGTKKRQAHAVPWHPTVREVVDWRASCHCSLAIGSGRCVVLDPFGGAGTTGLVSDTLARDSIIIELNGDYAAMAGRRTGTANE